MNLTVTLPPITSPFSAVQLQKWRQVLLDLRREAVGDLDQMDAEELDTRDKAESDIDPLDAAVTSQTRDIARNLAAHEQRLIRAIDTALVKIDIGMPVPFGICELTGMPIELPRLLLIPWTTVCSSGCRWAERNRDR